MYTVTNRNILYYRVHYDLLNKNLAFGRNLNRTYNVNTFNYQVPILIVRGTV